MPRGILLLTIIFFVLLVVFVVRSSLPLLKSRNSGVVLAVCSLHYYCGTNSNSTGTALGKALVRILRNAREIQYVVLQAIATMATERPQLFIPFLADFYIKATDPQFARSLKLQVLTALTVDDNVDMNSVVIIEDEEDD